MKLKINRKLVGELKRMTLSNSLFVSTTGKSIQTLGREIH